MAAVLIHLKQCIVPYTEHAVTAPLLSESIIELLYSLGYLSSLSTLSTASTASCDIILATTKSAKTEQYYVLWGLNEFLN